MPLARWGWPASVVRRGGGGGAASPENIFAGLIRGGLLEIRGSKILSLGHLCLSDSFDFPASQDI